VHFLGYRRDLANLYGGADLFLHPSRREGLGLAVLEAVRGGLPVVASDIRGIRDVLPEECRVQAGDEAAFARAIREQLDNPRKCNREIVASYRMEAVKQELLELIKSL
jgi:glycosyltransferase involved in cell wall biosynthesis